MELKIGDKVQYKAGGPQMLVDVIEGDNITCKWFDEKSNEYKSEDFNINQLVYIDPNEQTIFFGGERTFF